MKQQLVDVRADHGLVVVETFTDGHGERIEFHPEVAAQLHEELPPVIDEAREQYDPPQYDPDVGFKRLRAAANYRSQLSIPARLAVNMSIDDYGVSVMVRRFNEKGESGEERKIPWDMIANADENVLITKMNDLVERWRPKETSEVH